MEVMNFQVLGLEEHFLASFVISTNSDFAFSTHGSREEWFLVIFIQKIVSDVKREILLSNHRKW